MTAEIIQFPTPPSYLEYCHGPEDRYHANAMFEILAGAMPDATAERITRNISKRLEEAALRRGGPPPAS